jgi:uncharacterized protein (TIGR03437 family)
MVGHAAFVQAVRRFAPLVVLCATVTFAATPASLTISNETAPAGGWAQIKIYASKPMAIANGELVLNLSAAAFGPGAMVGLFGANGDATGLATTTAGQIDVQFTSATGGIGQLAGLPVMVISVPILASASGTVTVSATSPDSSVTVASGSVTIQGTLSVEKIYAGMGVVPAGTVLAVYGSGFTSSTMVAIDGVVLASTKFVSASEVDVTLGGATELVGKRVRVTDGGVEFDYFCFQPNDPVNFPGKSGLASQVVNIQPLFPLFAGTSGSLYNGSIGGVVEIQNPNPTVATVNVADLFVDSVYAAETAQTLSIPAGGWMIFQGDPETEFEMTSDLPVRVVGVTVCGLSSGYEFCPAALIPMDFSSPASPSLAFVPPYLLFGWQIGTPPPASQTVSVDPGYVKAGTVTSGAAWLSVVATSGSTSLTVSVNPSQLALGTYQGSIMVTQVYGPAATLPVTLTVSSAPVPSIQAAPQSLTFTTGAYNATPYTQTISISSNSGPAPFTVTASGGGGPPSCCYAWLKASPTSGTTPATVTVTWDPSVTSQIPYYQPTTNGSILIAGPANSITIPATFNVTGVQTYQTYLGESGLGPNGAMFSAQTGSAAQTQKVYVYPLGTMTATADQPWISAVIAMNTGLAEGEVDVTVDPAGLAPGSYTGSVTIAEAGLTPISVPVTLSVWTTPPKLTITKGSFTFVQTVGEATPPYQSTEIDSGGVLVPLTFLTGGSWLNLINRFTLTPAPLLVGVVANTQVLPGAVGEYDGSFTVQSPGSSVYAGVTLLVEPGPVTPAVVSQVVNGASGIAGGVSPGEILTIRGYSVGASAVSGIKLDPSGAVVSQLNGVHVAFDGQPAPLIYTSAYQTNLIVPYEVAGKTSTVMQVTYAAAAGTLQTSAWTLPVVAAAPGVFTVDSTGIGQGAIVNQDGTVNSAANPAARGSVVSIYATGEGQTSPAGVTGSVTGSGLKTPLLPVTITIGGIGATVQYAGSAPASVAGLLQVNAVVPPGISAGPAVPVLVTVGKIPSQAGVTIAVK